jgi:nicotinate-nucleotide--dimethylbenzimidazole phosphoribosyltransferase
MAAEYADQWHLSRSELVEIMDQTSGLDKRSMAAAEARWLALCKPLYSLGLLEDLVIQLAGIQQTDQPVLDSCGVFIFCADNGVVQEGVSQATQDVTATVTRNFLKGDATVNIFARQVQADVFPIDVGVAGLPETAGIFYGKIMPEGTCNLSERPAMSEEQALAAMAVGLNRAAWAYEQGYDICIGGEMGIGNTTTSAAVLSCILNEDPAELTGRGAGLDSVRYKKKIRVIRAALANHRPDPGDPVDAIAKVGGLDIAALVGFYLGCARHRMPVILDGLIALTAAVVAVRINPLVNYYLIPSHAPKEPGSAFALKALEKSAYIHLNLANGEGSGGLTLLPLLRMALAVYDELVSFDEGGIEAYQPLF